MLPQNLPEKLSFDYEFIRKIGEGANGETWLAEHRFNSTKAAIKCLKLDKIEDVKTLELFQREAELLKSINVQGVPQCYDYYPPQSGGNGYLVQEYIQAPSIQSIIDNGEKYSESQALMIASRVADILYHLEIEYQPPIIHRDIKPSNILHRQSDDMVYLIDFGSVANPQKRTGGSTVAGTFGYMPPEQIMGNVSIQSDYYALGATLLHILTGVPPYEMNADVFKIDIENALKTNGVTISDGLTKLLSTLLDPESSKRPPNALALKDLIQTAIEGKSPVHKQLFSFANLLAFIYRWLVPGDIKTKRSNLLNKSSLSANSSFSKILSGSSDSDLGFLSIQDIDKKISEGEDIDDLHFLIRNWVKCDGMARQYIFLTIEEVKNEGNGRNVINKRYIPGLEYTFEANGHVWSGFCAGRDTKLSLPHKCSVLYNPRNPRENALEFLSPPYQFIYNPYR